MKFKTLLLIVALLCCPAKENANTGVYEGQNTKITEQMNTAKKVRKISGKKTRFLMAVLPIIENIGYENIKNSVVLAQVALESGWLYKYPIEKNNVLGIMDGTEIRQFSSVHHCLDYHYILLEFEPRYKPVRQAETWQEQCDQLLKCGYAEDPSYSKKLKSIIKTNKLWQYDN